MRMHRYLILTALALCVISTHVRGQNSLSAEEKAAGWQLLFDGNSLGGWRASEAPGTFSVVDGQIVVHGQRSHLFYIGNVSNHLFKNFELRLDVMTFPHANSGVYFHTSWQETGFPDNGIEVQVNNSHKDPIRTASLYRVKDNLEQVARDGEWFELTIIVDGRHAVTKVNGNVVIDYTQENPPVRAKGWEGHIISSGTFALQGHDPGSETHFRNIRVRLLP